jgi:uncharacterized protein YbbK (DUF523 family)
VRDALRLWEQSRAGTREVWFDGRAIRCHEGVLAVWNPNREVLVLAPEPRTAVPLPRLAAFLAQVGPVPPQEAAAFLDAHLGALRALPGS